MRATSQRRMPQGFALGLGTAGLAALTGWFALWSWRPMIEHPQRMLQVELVCAVLIALVGTLGRSARLPAYVVPFVQGLVVLLFLDAHYAAAYAWHGVVPTRASITDLVTTVRAGASAIDAYVSPVSSDHPEIYPYLVICGAGLLIAVDLLACGIGRVPLAGLPLLLTLSIPISILQTSLSLVVFVTTALLYLMLLATEEIRRVLGWGRAIADRDQRFDSLDNVVTGGSVRSAAFRIGAVTTLGALVLPLVVPVAHGWFDDKTGSGKGPGSGNGITVVNPLVNLRRDLVRRTHTPLLYVQTDDPDPRYVQLTVLDEFNGDEWRPSARNLPDTNRADGIMPAAPGMASDTPGTTYDWRLRIDPSFQTPWLPTPYPVRRLSVSGDWRYDLNTLDVVDTGDVAQSRGLRYSLTAFHPRFEATTLDNAISAPGSVLGPMTALPRNLPPVIEKTASRITAQAPTDYQRAVALQDWFRAKGGFRYSLERAPGSGMTALAAFITTDRVGYCEQFAAAMAVMARSIGIPARVVIGFRSPSQRTGNELTYTSDDLHAWPELYFTGRGWVTFEPTPAVHTGVAPAYTLQQLPSAAPSSATPSPTATVSRGGAKDTTKAVTKKAASSRSHTPLWLPLGALVLLLLVLAVAPRAVRDARRRGRLDPAHDTGRFADDVWAELRDTCRDLGIPWPAERSPRATLRLLAQRVRPTGGLLERMESLLFFVERARYARELGDEESERVEVARTVGALEDGLRRTVSPARSRLARLLPVSVLTRARRTTGSRAPDRVDERV